MQKQKLSLDEAFELVMSRRSVIDPNINFIQQLQKFESFLKCQNSCQASQQPKSPAPWCSQTPVFSFPSVSHPSSSTSSSSVSSALSPSTISNARTHQSSKLPSSPFPNLPFQTGRCTTKESLRPPDLNLSPSSLSQTAASPSPRRVPSRPMSLPLVQLNTPSLPCRQNARSVGGSAAAESSAGFLVGSTFLLSPIPASPLPDFVPQFEDDVAMGTPTAHPAEGGHEFTFFTGELTCPDVTIPLDLASPRHPANRSAATRRDSPSGMFPKPHSPISPLQVPVSPVPLYGQPLAFV